MSWNLFQSACQNWRKFLALKWWLFSWSLLLAEETPGRALPHGLLHWWLLLHPEWALFAMGNATVLLLEGLTHLTMSLAARSDNYV